MGTQLRMPSITGSDREQLSQIRSYLYQFVPQLEWALNNLERSATSSQVVLQTPRSATSQTSTDSAEVAFADLKPLIIKSADIVKAYYDEISKRLVGVYVAESDFGTFVEQTEQRLTSNSTGIEQAFANLQQIITDIDNLNFTLAEVNARIKSGLLYYEGGVPVYGLEIGQNTTLDGEEVFKRFARFTADKLSFYDQNDTEVAYISDYKLYIRNVEIKDTFQEGGYKDFIDPNGGILTKWVGRG